MEFLNQVIFATNKFGIDFIYALQQQFPHGDKYFQTVTETANPQYAFSFLFPAFSVLNPQLATKVLMTAMLSEWVNALLKWLLMGHRPFWWVREFLEQAQPLRTPKLRQTPFTCETGPGNPSGHVMSFASIMFVLIYAALPLIMNHRSLNAQKKLRCLVWSLYGIAIALVSVSRLYVAAHFPHQCILGALIGVVLGSFVEVTSTDWMYHWNRRKLLKCVAVIWCSAFGGYWLQRLVGVDPQWSVKLAFKWCNSPDHIHVSTTPIFALTRDCGTALGLALAISAVPKSRKVSSKCEFFVMTTLQAAGVLIILWLSHLGRQSAPTKDARLYYVCIMLLNAALPFLLLVSIPKCINFFAIKIFSKNSNKKRN